MKFYKFISVILHPVVIPTIGVMLYFLLVQNNFGSNQKLAVLGLIFTTTYLIPLVILILFKKIKLIKSFKTEHISERKIPVLVMIVLFYLLGNTLQNVSGLRDLGLLFYATSLGLIFIYFFFVFKIKASIHLLSLGIFISFFMILGVLYSQSFLVVILVTLFLSGLLASARLYLKAHTTKEVYLGFLLGILSPFIIFYLL